LHAFGTVRGDSFLTGVCGEVVERLAEQVAQLLVPPVGIALPAEVHPEQLVGAVAVPVAADGLAVLEDTLDEFPVEPRDWPFHESKGDGDCAGFGWVGEVDAAPAVRSGLVIFGLPGLHEYDLAVDTAAPTVVERLHDHLKEQRLAVDDRPVDGGGGVLLPLEFAVLLLVGPDGGEHLAPVVGRQPAEV
jgi:hypothetical protein